MKIAFAICGGAVVAALSLTALPSQAANWEKLMERERHQKEAASNLPIPEVLAKVEPSIARVIVPMGVKTTFGTAFVFDDSGHFLTNCHVVSDDKGTVSNTVEVKFVGEHPQAAKVLGCDRLSDLAVLEVTGNFGGIYGPPAIPAATSIEVGDEVVAIGFALDIEGQPSVTRGIVSGLHRSMKGVFSDLIQTDASINHGNSGGPLINMHGQFVGVNSYSGSETILAAGTDLSNIKNEPISLDAPHGIFYARSFRTALPFARVLAAEGRVPRVDIGLSDVVSVSDDEAYELLKLRNGGLFIKAFSPGSPLQAAGLRKGDVIVSITTCSGPDYRDCRGDNIGMEDVGTLANALAAFAADKSSKVLEVVAARPPPCALEALGNNTIPSIDCTGPSTDRTGNFGSHLVYIKIR